MMNIHYAAGFFDGEGSISLRERGTPVVSVKNTDLRILEKFRERFGGRVYSTKVHGNRRPQWQWTVQAEGDVRQFLRRLHPYLLLKRPQASIMLQALELGRDKRRRQIDAIRALNRRGLPLGPRGRVRVSGRRMLERSR